MNPKISVITISYNNIYGLDKTIKSVISQDYIDYEYIVIDGGSKDGSKELLEKYSDKINYWVSEPDKGIYNAMNKGIAVAQGEYLIFMNSGDHFLDQKSLFTASQYLGNEDILYFNLKHIDDHHDWLHTYPDKVDEVYFYDRSLPHPASLIKKTAFQKFGVYDEDLKIVSDWKWFLLAICKNSATYRHINEIISVFYLDGISSHSDNIKKIKEESKMVYNSHFLAELPYIEEISNLRNTNRRLKDYEYKYNHLKKYRLVKMLAQLGLIKIHKQ